MTSSAIALTAGERTRFLELVDRRFGIRGSDYGASRVESAVSTLLPKTGYASASELLASFNERQNPGWLEELVEYLTIGETYFLRDSAQIAALRTRILPDVIARRTADRRLRVWSAGCSTGEEVYTLAMLLSEANLGVGWDVTLVGTDVNRESLRTARNACYPAWSFRTTPDEIRDRYFEPVKNGWRVIESVRRMARFAWMNLGAEPLVPPATDLDVVVCRNVTIYFDHEATQRLYRGLINSLGPGGWLVLGPSDPLPTDRRGLERIDLADTVIWRRAIATAAVERPQTPIHTVQQAARSVAKPKAIVGDEPDASDVPDELEAGLLALEGGLPATAVECFRRATFRHPNSPMAQFALARAYIDVRDVARAHAALLHTRRLLAPLANDALVPGSDALQVQTLREAVQTYLERPAA
jgi:chemotaxis protein methyltransferase CheR